MAPKKEQTVGVHTPLSIKNSKRMISRVVKAALDPEHAQQLEGWTKNAAPPVPMLYGPAGIGKTSLVYQAALENGINNVVMIRAAELRPEDVTGPPFPHLDEVPEGVKTSEVPLGFSRFHPPLALLQLTKEWTAQQRRKFELEQNAGRIPADQKFEEPGPALIFFDELPNAQPEMQAPLHSLILDRTFGVEGYHLRDNVVMVAAGNRLEDGAYVHELSAPMKTRLRPHILVSPTTEEWVQWARVTGVHPAIIAFLPQNEELINTFDKKSKAFTFANLRTWASASEVLALFEDDDELLLPALEGTIGPGAAATFFGFLKTARKAPTAEQIAKDPKGTNVFTNEPDIALVAVENMLANTRRTPSWVKRAFPTAKSEGEAFEKAVDAFCEYAARMHDQYKELFFPAILNVDGNMPQDTIRAVLKSPHFMKIQQTARELARVVAEGDKASATVKKARK